MQELAILPLSQRGSIIFLRALLAVLFMNLVLIASELFCMTGMMLISVLFSDGLFHTPVRKKIHGTEGTAQTTETVGW